MSNPYHPYRLADGARIVVLPTCGRCTKTAPECLCGFPANRKTPAPKGAT